MFEKFTKKIVSNVKETVTKTVENKLPIILGILTVGVTIFSLIDTAGHSSPKSMHSNAPIINNYYIYNGVGK